MSKTELLAKIELLNKYEAMIAEMTAQEAEEMIVGQYIIRFPSVLSNRFNSTTFQKVMPEIYKAYTKQVPSHRFTISM